MCPGQQFVDVAAHSLEFRDPAVEFLPQFGELRHGRLSRRGSGDVIGERGGARAEEVADAVQPKPERSEPLDPQHVHEMGALILLVPVEPASGLRQDPDIMPVADRAGTHSRDVRELSRAPCHDYASGGSGGCFIIAEGPVCSTE